MTCWDSGGEDGARLERYACERGESLERVGADMLAAELNRRHVAPVELPLPGASGAKANTLASHERRRPSLSPRSLTS